MLTDEPRPTWGPLEEIRPRYIRGHRYELLGYGRAPRHLADLEYLTAAQTDALASRDATAGNPQS